jgi:hypothetical protein
MLRYHWHFTSAFGATKNYLPLKEAPNGLGKWNGISKCFQQFFLRS